MAADRRPGGASQRPARRERAAGKEDRRQRLRAVLSFVPTVLKVVIVITLVGVVIAGYRVAATARLFQIRSIDIKGNSRASTEELQSFVKKEVAKTGVWQADLTDLSAKLQRLPWVRRAIVTRVLPDEVRVRITERVPRAVVHTSSGRLRWVDDDAVLLGEMLPTDQMPSFFLRGWNEEESEAARKENSEKVQAFLQLQREWESAGLAERVSEVNLGDIRDVRAQLAGDDSQIEVRLGAENLTNRLRQALQVLDQQRSTALGPLITYIIMNQKNPIVGHAVAVHNVNAVDGSRNPAVDEGGRKPSQNDNVVKVGRDATIQDKAAKNRNDKARMKERAKEDRGRRT
jgi:cell division protein FtsQ